MENTDAQKTKRELSLLLAKIVKGTINKNNARRR